MESREFTIINKLGLHARAAAKFVQVASAYQAQINVSKDGKQVNGKSIMGVMMLAAAKSSRIIVKADGDDATQALDAIQKLIDDRFGEGE